MTKEQKEFLEFLQYKITDTALTTNHFKDSVKDINNKDRMATQEIINEHIRSLMSASEEIIYRRVLDKFKTIFDIKTND